MHENVVYNDTRLHINKQNKQLYSKSMKDIASILTLTLG